MQHILGQGGRKTSTGAAREQRDQAERNSDGRRWQNFLREHLVRKLTQAQNSGAQGLLQQKYGRSAVADAELPESSIFP